jgi:hypothetical protein
MSRFTGRASQLVFFGVVFVLCECATRTQHGFTAEGDCRKIAYFEVNIRYFIARRFRVDGSATDELESPLVAFGDGASRLNVPLSQINVGASLVLAQPKVRAVLFEVAAFREANTGELYVVVEASCSERRG